MVSSYLLDTNQVSRLLQGDERMDKHVARVGVSALTTSVMVVGELYYMAYASKRIQENVIDIDELLKKFTIFTLDKKTAIIYGNIKDACYRQFGPKDKKRRSQIAPSQVGLDDNDLWILASAIRHNCTLVSADRHFERIQQVRDFPLEAWWSPEVE
jgi:tRNA(fMet)-specific endonuclease VapC